MSKTGSFVKLISIITVVFILIATFASCGAKDGRDNGYIVGDGSPNMSYKDSVSLDIKAEAENAYGDMYYYSQSGSMTGSSFEESDTQQVADPLASRKVIKNVNIVAETKSLDATISSLEAQVKALGGYVQSSNTSGKIYEKYSNRRANYTLRIPAELLDSFLSSVSGMMNITSKTEKVDDITDTYTDIEARLKTLKTEEARLLELLAKAEKLSDVITLEERISNVRYEIESYEARIRNYDTLIAFSTINVEIAEVIDYTPEPIKDPSFGDRIGEAFNESWEEFAENWKNFAVGFVYSLPTLIVLAVIACVITVIIVSAVKKSKKRRRNQMNGNGDN